MTKKKVASTIAAIAFSATSAYGYTCPRTSYAEFIPNPAIHEHLFQATYNTGWKPLLSLPVNACGSALEVRLEVDAAVTISAQSTLVRTSPTNGGLLASFILSQTGSLLVWPTINRQPVGQPKTILSQSRNQQMLGSNPSYMGDEQRNRESVGWTFHIPAAYIPAGTVQVGALYMFNSHRYDSVGVMNSDSSLWLYDSQLTVTRD